MRMRSDIHSQMSPARQKQDGKQDQTFQRKYKSNLKFSADKYRKDYSAIHPLKTGANNGHCYLRDVNHCHVNHC